ncbi:MAG: alkaline phosphatase [Flavihumibacter sp.]
MKRRSFLEQSALSAFAVLNPWSPANAHGYPKSRARGRAKNIIFMVSDGMSTGTLNMASLLLERSRQQRSHWLRLYDENKVSRALMDTASASSLVTDSAAASSAWGGGRRVNNGSLNVAPDGQHRLPLLQKFKEAGKAVGCVTTVPVTHATPAGFCISNGSRGDMAEIATQYLPLQFDLFLGGGTDYFSAGTRKDGRDMNNAFRQKGYQYCTDTAGLLRLQPGRPALGLFAPDALPYALDRLHNTDLAAAVPSLAVMTREALRLLSGQRDGFVLQVEAGKVDWAAHANDIGALLFDQVDFDDAVAEAIRFAEKDGDTLVVITTDHGNANPGLFYGKEANDHFDHIARFQHTNDWILNGIDRQFTVEQTIDRVWQAQQIRLQPEEAKNLLQHYEKLDETGVQRPEAAFPLPGAGAGATYFGGLGFDGPFGRLCRARAFRRRKGVAETFYPQRRAALPAAGSRRAACQKKLICCKCRLYNIAIRDRRRFGFRHSAVPPARPCW